MGKLYAVILNPKFYAWVVFLMSGAMICLVVWSTWFGVKPGIVDAPLSSYDYIVVGGGTAGCVLAAKLSANASLSVLLIEAGHQFNWLASIPLAAPVLQGSAHDWAYVTQPQTHSSYGLFNQTSSWPRGRGLGGSGQINFLLHYSGNDDDFSRWERGGAEGWGPRDINPHMSSVLGREANALDTSCSNNYKYVMTTFSPKRCQQVDAKIQISRDLDSELGRIFVAAGKELDYDFALVESTTKRGQRWTSYDGFLRPSLHRSNLHVLLNTRVDKVVWTEEGKRAMGVIIHVANKQPQVVLSKREVILSAGAINTPQILLRSGVGPKKLLHKLGVPVISELPVGMNLHDHLNMPLYISINESISVTLRKLLRPSTLWDYMVHAKGPLASSGIVGVGTAPSHLGLALFAMGSADERLLRSIANFRPETFHGLFPFSHDSSHEGFIFLATCLQPKSRGRITLANVEPFSQPIIDPQYMTQPSDITCMIDAVKLALQVASSSLFERLAAKLHLPLFEECAHLEASFSSTAYLECIIRTAAITGYHPGGSCKMGSTQDNTSVVDPSLRVHGVEALRVMDASVLPTPVSGHPNSVLVAMADKAAQMILQ